VILIVRAGSGNSSDTLRDISSWIVYDELSNPAWVGIEYRMQGGTAWTLASASDQDFYKILMNSGILHTEISGITPGKTGLLCTPVLGRGVPRYYESVHSFLACAGDGTPFFYLAEQGDGFHGMYHTDPGFKEKLGLVRLAQKHNNLSV
jgi:hypothetical protein